MRQTDSAFDLKRKPRTISTFLKKTYQLLNDQCNLNSVRWASNGIGFIIINEDLFSREVLPKYFKHSNYSSFVRQLNMYNFHKIRENNQDSYFHHEHFDRSNKNAMSQIKRKPEKKKKKGQESEGQALSQQEDAHKSNHRCKKSNISVKQTKQTISQKRLSIKILKQNQSQNVVNSSKNSLYIYEEEGQALERGGSDSQRQLSMLVEEDQKFDKFDYNLVRMPRMATRELICASKNNLFPISIENVQNSTLSIFY